MQFSIPGADGCRKNRICEVPDGIRFWFTGGAGDDFMNEYSSDLRLREFLERTKAAVRRALELLDGRAHSCELMVQSTFQQNGRGKRKSGEMTAEGRRSQIQYKLDHGIRAISPVLLGVEREEDWREHFEGVSNSLAPGNEFELDLAYLLAWQLWRFGRLSRHETALTNEN
jgi:hypothetical protein